MTRTIILVVVISAVIVTITILAVPQPPAPAQAPEPDCTRLTTLPAGPERDRLAKRCPRFGGSIPYGEAKEW